MSKGPWKKNVAPLEADPGHIVETVHWQDRRCKERAKAKAMTDAALRAPSPHSHESPAPMQRHAALPAISGVRARATPAPNATPQPAFAFFAVMKSRPLGAARLKSTEH